MVKPALNGTLVVFERPMNLRIAARDFLLNSPGHIRMRPDSGDRKRPPETVAGYWLRRRQETADLGSSGRCFGTQRFGQSDSRRDQPLIYRYAIEFMFSMLGDLFVLFWIIRSNRQTDVCDSVCDIGSANTQILPVAKNEAMAAP